MQLYDAHDCFKARILLAFMYMGLVGPSLVCRTCVMIRMFPSHFLLVVELTEFKGFDVSLKNSIPLSSVTVLVLSAVDLLSV